MINRLICKVLGHRRGKLTGLTKDAQEKVLARTFKCRRCDATWSRKPKGTQ